MFGYLQECLCDVESESERGTGSDRNTECVAAERYITKTFTESKFFLRHIFITSSCIAVEHNIIIFANLVRFS